METFLVLTMGALIVLVALAIIFKVPTGAE